MKQPRRAVVGECARQESPRNGSVVALGGGHRHARPPFRSAAKPMPGAEIGSNAAAGPREERRRFDARGTWLAAPPAYTVFQRAHDRRRGGARLRGELVCVTGYERGAVALNDEEALVRGTRRGRWARSEPAARGRVSPRALKSSPIPGCERRLPSRWNRHSGRRIDEPRAASSRLEAPHVPGITASAGTRSGHGTVPTALACGLDDCRASPVPPGVSPRLWQARGSRGRSPHPPPPRSPSSTSCGAYPERAPAGTGRPPACSASRGAGGSAHRR
jgi:hypothetical protein